MGPGFTYRPILGIHQARIASQLGSFGIPFVPVLWRLACPINDRLNF